MAVDPQRMAEMKQAAAELTGQRMLVGAFADLGLTQPMVDMETAEDLTADGRDVEIVEQAAAHQAALDEKGLNYAMKGGFDSTSAAGQRLNVINEGGGGIGSKSGGRKAQERAYREALLAALENGTLPELIAAQIIGGMSDEAIGNLVEEIEAETGQSFEDYAAERLGEEAAQRLPGESLDEYRRRVLTALAEEMLDEDGNIKPEYANDPLAGMLRDNEDFQRVRAQVDSWQAREASGENDAELATDVDRETDGDFAGGDLAGHTLEGPQSVDAARVNQVEHRESVSETAIADNEDAFAATAMFASSNTDGLVTGPSSLDGAELANHFNASSEAPSPADDQSPSIETAAVPIAERLPT